MSENNNKPNYFCHAYTESSQDGFICWLIDWTRCDVEPEYEQIKKCGQGFLKALFSKHCEKIPKDLALANVKFINR